MLYGRPGSAQLHGLHNMALAAHTRPGVSSVAMLVSVTMTQCCHCCNAIITIVVRSVSAQSLWPGCAFILDSEFTDLGYKQEEAFFHVQLKRCC